MRWELEAGAVAAVRFGISPLFELAALVRRLRRNAQGGFAPAAWEGWRTDFAILIKDPDVRLVLGLSEGRTGSLLWVPGTPTLERTFAEDLQALRQLPDDLVRSDLERLGVDTITAVDLDQFRNRVESGMTTLWHALLDNSWPAVRSVAEHEISRVTSVLQGCGWEGVFDSVAAGVSWDGDALEISDFDQADDHESRQPGLIMMPSIFVQSGPVVWYGSSGTPVIVFPARGIGNLFSAWPNSADPLAALLGPNRARILRVLQSPTTVTRLHELLGLSLGSLSRQLTVIVDAGLASSRRVGRTVEYELTSTGRTLLAAQPVAQVAARSSAEP